MLISILTYADIFNENFILKIIAIFKNLFLLNQSLESKEYSVSPVYIDYMNIP